MKANFKIENFRDILFAGKYFELHNNFKFESFHYDRQTLSEVTFFPSSERDEMEQFLNQMEPDEDDDIIYTFIGEQILRIGCENVILTFK
jgi:hypothetical protein